MGQQSPGAVLSSAFEQLVMEHNRALSADHARLSSAVDLTERRQSEASLRKTEQRFRQRLKAFPAAVYTTDAAGRITFYNDAAVAFAGRRAQLGTDQWCVTWRLYQPDGTPLPHHECPMATALKENQPIRGVQAIAERPDGSRAPFVPHPTPLRDASGALVGAVNMLLDISEPLPAVLDGARVLVVTGDIFVAADLDLLIDDAGGVTAALAVSPREALMLLSTKPFDAAVVSPPLQEGELKAVIDALASQGVPFVLHEGSDDEVVQKLADALSVPRGDR
jgi:PAS domain S-box-containing protein